jgi:hypothetical protein
MLNVFKTDAFSTVSLTDAFIKKPYQPRRLGKLGLFRESGIPNTTAVVEYKDGQLSLITSSPRGGPGSVSSARPSGRPRASSCRTSSAKRRSWPTRRRACARSARRTTRPPCSRSSTIGWPSSPDARGHARVSPHGRHAGRHPRRRRRDDAVQPVHRIRHHAAGQEHRALVDGRHSTCAARASRSRGCPRPSSAATW